MSREISFYFLAAVGEVTGIRKFGTNKTPVDLYDMFCSTVCVPSVTVVSGMVCSFFVV
jgi:hypothetical protein